uniref:Uncharacterized protein n=1 Tax=Paraburkholderia sprentiae WSM5005 TaxID=754502 RepID=A0A1I9YGY4_9BURK
MHRRCTASAHSASLAANYASSRRDAHPNEARRARLHQFRAAAAIGQRIAPAPTAAPQRASHLHRAGWVRMACALQ